VEIIKKKILLENLTSRKPDASYGAITATTLSFNIYLTQSVDDLGVSTDIPFVDESWLTSATLSGLPNVNNVLVKKLVDNGIVSPFTTWDNPSPFTFTGDTSTLRISGSIASDYFSKGGKIEALTDSKADKVQSYNALTPYQVGFDVSSDVYTNYEGVSINGVDRVVQILVNGLRYTTEANDDANIGTINQNTGLSYIDDNSVERIVVHTDTDTTYVIPETTVTYQSEGCNEFNTSLSATVKEEYLIGIAEPPEVLDDVFIDRGLVSVFDRHMRLSEIKTTEDLYKYGNGYYNIKR